jgi:hypothetical protein
MRGERRDVEFAAESGAKASGRRSGDLKEILKNVVLECTFVKWVALPT